MAGELGVAAQRFVRGGEGGGGGPARGGGLFVIGRSIGYFTEIWRFPSLGLTERFGRTTFSSPFS